MASLLCAALSAPAPAPRPGLPVLSGELIGVGVRQISIDIPEGAVRLLAAVALESADGRFGGLSGLTVSSDGDRVLMVSDRGHLLTARLRRAEGTLTGVDSVRLFPLADADGAPLAADRRDAEALARLPGGGIVVAFEGEPRLWRLRVPGDRAFPLALPPEAVTLQVNSGLEALAADEAGRLYAIPERSGDLARPFPVWRREALDGAWTEGRWPRRPPFLVTAADIGPDGRLYVLERDFAWLRGVSMRLSRADLGQWPDLVPETLVTLRGGGIDNMEGVGLWRDASGTLRAVLVSDDNFHPLQRTLLIELALPG